MKTKNEISEYIDKLKTDFKIKQPESWYYHYDEWQPKYGGPASKDITYIKTVFTVVYFKILYDIETNRIRIITNVSPFAGWKAFEHISKEWSYSDIDYNDLKECYLKYLKIVHFVNQEEQKIQKSFKISIRKFKASEDFL